MPGLNEGLGWGATGMVEGLDHPAGSPPGDAFPCHIRLFPFMLYIDIGGSVAQFIYRFILHA